MRLDKNEALVAEALSRSSLKREDVFIVSKLQPRDMVSMERAYESALESLSRLGTDYFDLYAIPCRSQGFKVAYTVCVYVCVFVSDFLYIGLHVQRFHLSLKSIFSDVMMSGGHSNDFTRKRRPDALV